MDQTKFCPFVKDADVRAVGVIPSYRPDDKLMGVVSGCFSRKFLDRLLVVDDGSGVEFAGVFASIAAVSPLVRVLHLGVNSGMGGAIKFGLQVALHDYPDADGFVVFDADGQHAPDDVEKIVRSYQKTDGRFVIGVREFHDPSLRIPLRSRFGNRLTEIVFRLFVGVHVTDTQSGLRFYPRKAAERCTQLLHNRYEFQLEALIDSVLATGCLQVPIQTIYEDGNRRSHFNPILDSLRIYAVFLRPLGIVLACLLADYFIFATLRTVGLHLWICLALSCGLGLFMAMSIKDNLLFDKFRSTGRKLAEFVVRYSLLVGVSYGTVRWLVDSHGWSPLSARAVVLFSLPVCSLAFRRFVLNLFARRSVERTGL